MVVLSKAQQRNKKIETLIDDLWDLSKHGIEFKFEMKLWSCCRTSNIGSEDKKEAELDNDCLRCEM